MVAPQPGRPRQRGGCPGHAAAEEVGGDVPLPYGLLQDRAVVVRAHLGLGHHGRLAPPGTAGRTLGVGLRLHRRRSPKTDATTAPAKTSAAFPAAFHMAGRSAVVTTGSGGSRYTSGSSSNRKKAPMP